ncbi:MAG: RrF2 family transcriptional regulator [Eubacteriaceae bacterium]
MKLSTKGRYGLRAMFELATNSNNEYISLNNISMRQDISIRYLEQVFSLLKKANLVKSTKGFQGGYMITKDTSNITVGEILRALEGNISLVELEHEKRDLISESINKQVWTNLNNRVNGIIDSITLEDIIKDSRNDMDI